MLLVNCIGDPNAMFLTGDTAQSIMKGVAFRFSDLKSLFHYASLSSSDKQYLVKKPRRIYELYQNYRSHSGIKLLLLSYYLIYMCLCLWYSNGVSWRDKGLKNLVMVLEGKS